MYVFPYIANIAFRLNAVKRFVFPRVSQIAINYRGMSLSRGGDGFAVKSGDRMPWFEVEGASIYDRLREPKFHLLVFYDGKSEIPSLPDDLMREWNEQFDSTVVSLYPNVTEIFGTNESFYLILRPDNYIGIISNDFSPDEVRKYLALVSR
jgi:hypothetical protein